MRRVEKRTKMMFELSIVMAPIATAATPSTGCAGLEALNPLCYAVSAVGSIGGSVASAGIGAVLGGLSQWVASGAEWLLSQIGDVLVSTTTIDLGASWFTTHYKVMTELAAVVVLPLLLVSTLQAVYRQNASQLLRAFFVQLPLALLLGVVAIQIVILCLSATDAMCAEVVGGAGSDVKTLLSGMTRGLVVAGGDPAMATFVLLLVGLLVAAAAFVLWLELLVRAAAVYVAVLFLPLAMATLVWPSVAHWCRRLVETLTALILSKFVIVATLSLAAGAVASGTAGTGDAGAGFASVLAGGALLVLATFVPFSILRLIPMVEAGAIAHLEGARQRGATSLTRVPRTAAQYALRKGMAASGAAKLAAQAGPPGTGGASGSEGTASMWKDMAGTPADCNVGNGGLIPDENGQMIGLAGSEEAFMERMRAEPPPRGPIPLLPSPAEARRARLAAADDGTAASTGTGANGRSASTGTGANGRSASTGTARSQSPVVPQHRGMSPDYDADIDMTADLPPGTNLIGKPGPYDRRYALGNDHVGVQLQSFPPLRSRDEKPSSEGPGSS
jgi:hypothetical protein